MADIKTWKKDFLAERKKKEEAPSSIAQRFINIYRQLPILGEEAVKKYNDLLISQTTAEVLIALTNLPGGEEIREYINFLKHKNLEEREELESSQKANLSLPKAEELSPLWETLGINSVSHVNAQTAVNDVVQTVISIGKKDIENLKKQILPFIHRQNEDVSNILKYIIVDSDIEKMQQTLTQAIKKISSLQENNERILNSLFEQAEVNRLFSQEDIISSKEKQENNINTPKKSSPSKAVFTATTKNKRLHPLPKYSVDLIEEEDS